MSKLIYIGNQLQTRGLNPTTVDTLGDKLSVETDLVRASRYGNPVLRLLHMWITVFKFAGKPNIVLIDTYSTSAFLYAWTTASICRMLNMKYIPYLHGGSLPERYRKDYNRCKTFFEKAYRIVSPSNYLKVETEKVFNVEVTVTPNYLELENYPVKTRKTLKRINLLWVRSFDKIYNPTMALEIVHQLKEEGYVVSLTMVGPDKDGTGDLCKQMVKEMGIDDRVRFTGRLEKSKWIELSSSCNLFINTTNADNTPVSVMEAMALGMPVITTNVGGIPYLFEDGKEGIMVGPNNAKLFVDSILKLYKNPERTESISKNARLKAESWDWNTVKKQWAKLLDYA